jgi:hypothetical protein
MVLCSRTMVLYYGSIVPSSFIQTLMTWSAYDEYSHEQAAGKHLDPLQYLLAHLQALEAWGTDLDPCQRGTCTVCMYLWANLCNELGAFLRERKNPDAETWTIGQCLAYTRRSDNTNFLLPTFHVGAGLTPDLETEMNWNFEAKGRMTSVKFLSQFLTLSMQEVFPTRWWTREYGTIRLPKSFGKDNVKAGAIQDAARLANTPNEMINFGDHKGWNVHCTYVVTHKIRTFNPYAMVSKGCDTTSC